MATLCSRISKLDRHPTKVNVSCQFKNTTNFCNQLKSSHRHRELWSSPRLWHYLPPKIDRKSLSANAKAANFRKSAGYMHFYVKHSGLSSIRNIYFGASCSERLRYTSVQKWRGTCFSFSRVFVLLERPILIFHCYILHMLLHSKRVTPYMTYFFKILKSRCL